MHYIHGFEMPFISCFSLTSVTMCLTDRRMFIRLTIKPDLRLLILPMAVSPHHLDECQHGVTAIAVPHVPCDPAKSILLTRRNDLLSIKCGRS